MQNPYYNEAKASLIIRKLQPENKEAPIQFMEAPMTDHKLFYRRNHFSYPRLAKANYWLPVNGHVRTPKLFSIDELRKLPSRTIKVTMECAGNKRRFFEPKVFGEQWEKGAISQGYWKGVSLHTVLQQAGLKQGAKEVVFEGYDYGVRTDLDAVVSFVRSLPLKKALHPDTIIAYEYNNQPIPFRHGFPLRLIVPQWYAMASVKWLKQITIIDQEFSGPFQTIDYMYYPNKETNDNAQPVTTLNVNSIIQKPLHMEILNTGIHPIKGIAWTGKGIITKVEISTDNGETWSEAKIQNQTHGHYGWVTWEMNWKITKKGEFTILSRASDSHGRVQPATPLWNRKGYGYNAIDKVNIKIE